MMKYESLSGFGDLVEIHNRIKEEEEARRTKPFLDYALEFAEEAAKSFEHILLRGSLTRGNYEHKDIDLMLIGDEKNIDWKARSYLNKMTREMPVRFDLTYLNQKYMTLGERFMAFINSEQSDPLFYLRAFRRGLVFDKKKKVFVKKGKRIKLFRDMADSLENLIPAYQK